MHPALTPARQAGIRFACPGGTEGWVGLVGLVKYPQTVTRLSTNPARHRATSLMRPTMLPQSHSSVHFSSSHCSIIVLRSCQCRLPWAQLVTVGDLWTESGDVVEVSSRRQDRVAQTWKTWNTQGILRGILCDLGENCNKHSIFSLSFKYLVRVRWWPVVLLQLMWNDPWWRSLLHLLFVAITYGKVSLLELSND